MVLINNIFIIIPLVIIMNGIANILIKKGATCNRNIYFNMFTPFGYLCFLFVMLLSIKLIGLIEVKYFALVMAVNYMITFICGLIAFKEKTNIYGMIGILLVCVGTIIFIL